MHRKRGERRAVGHGEERHKAFHNRYGGAISQKEVSFDVVYEAEGFAL